MVEVEDLKEKLAAVMNHAEAYVKEIEDLKKKLAKEEEECRAFHEQILQLKMKVEKQHTKLGVERNRVKFLCFVTVGLWVFVTLLSIVIAMNIGGPRKGL